MSGSLTAEYFAVPDPADAARMTYWRRSKGKLKPWPAKARYGPTLLRSDVPAGLKGGERQEWLHDWFDRNALPWWRALHAAIGEDERGCAARFAAFTARCCECGRLLTDPASKSYGVGPECRDGWPDGLLAAMAEAVGRAHASSDTAAA